MSDKVFWGAVGGVVVLVLAALFFLVIGPSGEYGKQSAALKSRVKSLKKFAQMDVEELPTDALIEAHEKRLDQMKERVQATQKFYSERDERFESYLGGLRQPDISTWTAQYSDANNALLERYKAHTAETSLADAPWEAIRNVTDVLEAQKKWRCLSSLVEATLAIPGSRIRLCNSQSARNLPEYEHFEMSRYRMIVEIPPSQMSALIEKVLADNDVNFMLSSANFIKNLNELTTSTVRVVPPQTPENSEPNVLARLEFDVMDWAPLGRSRW